eukprot:408521-Pyramimonas_sp.AAC.1
MVEFNTTYRIDSWGWNGPELVTRVAGRFPRGTELHILPTIGFYPIHWAKVAKYFTGARESKPPMIPSSDYARMNHKSVRKSSITTVRRLKLRGLAGRKSPVTTANPHLETVNRP